MQDITLFFSPHQDDEIISMGIGILKSLDTDEVHVILCTDGSKSNVKNVLNNKRICRLHFGMHRYNLSKEEFVTARDREFIDSCKALGIKEDHIHIADNRTVDGELTVEKSTEIVKYYLDKYNSCKVRTITPFGCEKQHSDHKNLGKACLELYKKCIIEDLEFYIEPYHYDEFISINNIDVQVNKPMDKERIEKALDSYKLWKPKNGRYAVGYHSIKKDFDDFKKECLSYVHRID